MFDEEKEPFEPFPDDYVPCNIPHKPIDKKFYHPQGIYNIEGELIGYSINQANSYPLYIGLNQFKPYHIKGYSKEVQDYFKTKYLNFTLYDLRGNEKLRKHLDGGIDVEVLNSNDLENLLFVLLPIKITDVDSNLYTFELYMGDKSNSTEKDERVLIEKNKYILRIK